MPWEIDVEGQLVESDPDGLVSVATSLVEGWVADGGGFIRTDPYNSSITYDPTNETMVLSAHLQMYKDLGFDVTVVNSTVPSMYVQHTPDVRARPGDEN